MTLTDLFRATTFRWTLGIVVALILQSLLISGLLYVSTVQHATSEIDSAIMTSCRSLSGLGYAGMLEEVGEKVLQDVHRVDLVGLFDADGRAVAGNIASLPTELKTQDGPLTVDLVRSNPPDPVPNASRSFACAIPQGGRLVVARDTDAIDGLKALIERALFVATVPAILAAALLGVILGFRGQARFRLVQQAVDDVMAGDLERRLPHRSSRDPFDRLSRAVNDMLDRLQEAIKDVRGLGDDIAHELRTPLTRMRACLERGCEDAEDKRAFRDVGERAIRDIDHALSIVSAILRIRAIETAKRGSEFTSVDVRGLLEDACDLYRPTADEHGVDIEIDKGPPAIAIADRDLLMEAVCNLIDNAIKFTPAGGRVRCSLMTKGRRVETIKIADTGPGIQESERENVFRRFHRGATQGLTEGHGIGLSLVAAIVRLHRFSLKIDDEQPGCSVTIDCRDGGTYRSIASDRSTPHAETSEKPSVGAV
ncbi:putative Signal transduction histidine kinase (plasmid) [Beijerinckiaceae bacterium RH AL1]|nr:HAMP domain-containing sensor histidine kinase [Beijerinckiaceae bacterium]VVB50250.1 putative Signal transduction histidine kinase [Beijerinckiaceae bacterium RH CH11]VVB50259.1 putative Signal transduction histidine kinase [Beijerinckiaceae bacterium RH AL8]VVC57305.1 putative Signal transduction histidine kinase [Beijerinckiaceae bacterium RH AL1]